MINNNSIITIPGATTAQVPPSLENLEAGAAYTVPAPRVHDLLSLWLAIFQNVFSLVAFVCVMPTATDYVTSLGGSMAFAGLTIAVFPFVTALLVCAWSSLLSRTSFGFCFKLSSVLQLAGGVLYALAGLSGSLYTILASRALLGMSAGLTLNLLMLYVAHTVPSGLRSRVWLEVNVAFCFSYAVGQLLAADTIAFCNSTASSNQTVTATASGIASANAAPGWIAAVLFSVLILCFVVWFKEPPAVSSDKEVAIAAGESEQEQDQARVSTTAAYRYLMVAIVARVASAIPVTCVQVLILRVGQARGLSTVGMALYVAAIMFVTACSTLAFRSKALCGEGISDRTLTLFSLVTAAVVMPLLYLDLWMTDTTALLAATAAATTVVLTSLWLTTTGVGATVVKVPQTKQSLKNWANISSVAGLVSAGVGGLIADALPMKVTLGIMVVLCASAAVLVAVTPEPEPAASNTNTRG
jgi:MFS family permease